MMCFRQRPSSAWKEVPLDSWSTLLSTNDCVLGVAGDVWCGCLLAKDSERVYVAMEGHEAWEESQRSDGGSHW